MIIDKGKILREGTLEELVDENHGEKVIEFTLEDGRPSLDALREEAPFPIQWDPAIERGVVTLRQMESQLPEFILFLRKKNLRLKNMECRRRTLDDLFTLLTGRHLNE